MIKNKSRVLKGLYRRTKYRPSASAIIMTDILLSEAVKLATLFPGVLASSLGSRVLAEQDEMRFLSIDKARGVDKTVYSAITNGKVEPIEEAEFKEIYEASFKNIEMSFTQRFLDNIGESKFSFFVKLGLSITITVGVYLWLI